MEEKEIFEIIDKQCYPALKLFEKTIRFIESKYDKPIFVQEENHKAWRYKEIGRENICIIRSVRIISGLFACFELLKKGFVQELLSIMRTINDFQQDIIFLLENYKNELSKNQNELIQNIITDTFNNRKIPLKGVKSISTISRDKIMASQSRRLNSLINQADSKKIEEIDSDVFSRYVHASYECVMEMYGGQPPFSNYYMEGLLGTPRIYQGAQQIVIFVSRQFNVMNLQCICFGLAEQSIILNGRRKEFDSINYPKFGLKTELNPEITLRKLKAGKLI
jgi:hypothetical protein